MTHPELIVVTFFLINLAILVWFIVSMNRINSSLIEIIAYTRRTALSLPLTTGQAKLVNKTFSAGELVSLLKKQGVNVQLNKDLYIDSYGHDLLTITSTATVDPEVLKLAWASAREVVNHLRSVEAATSVTVTSDESLKK